MPTGSFVGSVDLVTAFQIAEVRPVTGHIDFATFTATATSVLNIKVVRVSPVLAPFVNLVGSACTTSRPVTVTMSGLASLTAASTFRGT